MMFREQLSQLPLSPVADHAQRFFTGDHWQDGRQWIGPRPSPDDAGATDAWAEIKRTFVSRNVVREVVERLVGAVTSRVQWRVTTDQPSRATDAAMREMEQGLLDWWERHNMDVVVLHVVARLALMQRVPVRLVVVQDDRPVMDRIMVDLPAPTVAGIIHDDRKQPMSVYEPDDTYSEVSQVLTDGTTSFTVRTRQRETERVDTAILDLRGRLLLYDATVVTPYVTESVLAMQRVLNLAYTMLARNVIMGGFLERVLLNAQLPGRWVTNPDGGRRFVPEPLRFGAGAVVALQGAEIRDDTNTLTGYANPSILYRDPVPVDTFRDTIALAYRGILEETGQLHALLSGDAVASGVARQQATADFLSRCTIYARALERLIIWLLETVWWLACALDGRSAVPYRDLRVAATVTPTVGVTDQDIAALVRIVDAGLMSRETALARLGIADTDAELQRIAMERDAQATLPDRVLAAFNAGRV